MIEARIGIVAPHTHLDLRIASTILADVPLTHEHTAEGTRGRPKGNGISRARASNRVRASGRVSSGASGRVRASSRVRPSGGASSRMSSRVRASDRASDRASGGANGGASGRPKYDRRH